MKIVLFGDSIIQGRTGIEPEESYFVALQQLLSSEHTLINSGVGGNSTREMMRRFENDVLAHAPDLVIFEPGGNNRDRRPGREHRTVEDDEYMELLEKFSNDLPENCRVIICTFPPIINEQHQFYHLVPGGLLDEGLQPQRKLTRSFAQKKNWPLLDLYELILPNKYEYILPDGVHLSPAGHQFMAEKIVEALKNNFPESF